MKRVVAFFDMFDTIPDNAKYLFSNKFEFPIPESEEEKTHRIISSNPQEAGSHKAVIFIHYYEVDTIDFEELMETDFIKTPNTDKMKNFMQQYKIPTKS
jgi:hypothetical protein